MNFKLYDFDFNNDLQFKDFKSLCLSVENVKVFSDMVKYFKGFCGENKKFCLFNDRKEEMFLNKDYAVIIDLFDFEITSKQIVGKVIKRLSERCDKTEEIADELNDKKRELFKALYNFLLDFNIEFDYKEECETEDLFKLFSIVPSKFDDSLVDKYLNFIEIVCELKLYDLLVLINAKPIFNQKEIEEIQKLSAHKGLNLLFLENRLSKYFSAYEDNYLIDEDLFLTKIG